MSRYYCIIILAISLLRGALLFSQEENFLVRRAPFSSGINDEFSPVFYKDGIVYCSNQRDNSLIVFKGDDSRLFNLFLVRARGKSNWSQPSVFSKELKSGVNFGPVTFNSAGNIMYFNRNNSTGKGLRNISDTSNKLGIYYAEAVNGLWTGVKPFQYNDPLYTFCTPSLAHDGKRIYFASDMPGGSGGMDLYYCDSLAGGWTRPVNLGPVINTPKNESFPYAGVFGKLYFASDGHNGFGGKDLFYSIEIDGKWINPVHLDSAINSPADDFGIVTDSTFSKGFFSTNRLKTDDIFSFSMAPVEFGDCDSLTDNYCFTFFDEHHRLADTVPLIYSWDFGGGIIKTGREAGHCFPGPGEYKVILSIFDKLTGDSISKRVVYNLKLEEKNIPYIEASDLGLTNKHLDFNGSIKGLRDFRVTGVFWDFGEGFKPGSLATGRTFGKEGDYLVKLGLTGDKDSLGNANRRCVVRKVKIFDSFINVELSEGKVRTGLHTETATSQGGTRILKLFVYLGNDLTGNQKSIIQTGFNEIINSTMSFTQDDISDTSENVLQQVSSILNKDKGLRVEIAVHSDKTTDSAAMSTAQKLARELGFWLKNKGLSRERYNYRGIDSLSSDIIGFIPDDLNGTDGYVELIFVKK
jgi:hypothetical protein